jgi:hypothetical protein
MKTPNGSMTFARFYDSVLREIEFGRIDGGINLLVGLLDAVHLLGSAIDKAREELTGHVLHQMLLEDPLYAHAARNPGDYTGLVKIAAHRPTAPQTSTTGRRLFEATSNLPITQALIQRQATVEQKLQRAWKDGQRICILGRDTSGAHPALSGRDNSNVTHIDPFPIKSAQTDRIRKGLTLDDDHSYPDQLESHSDSSWSGNGLDIGASDWPEVAARSGKQFDLILLPEVADTLDTAELISLIAQVKPFLRPAGAVILSALRPDHLGSGWRRACLNWHPNMHDLAALQRAASEAGFSAQTYGDQNDCIIWGTLRPEHFPTIGGEKNHAY